MDTEELSELHQRHPPIWVKEIELYKVINGVLCCYYEPTSRKRRQITQLQAKLAELCSMINIDCLIMPFGLIVSN